MSAARTRNVLILRPDEIGDSLLFSGALEPIRRHWPNARIDLAVQSHIRPLFEYCPHVDRVLSTSRFTPWQEVRKHWLRGTWLLERFLKHPAIRPLWYPCYDVVLYPVSAPTERFLEVVRLLSAREKWGYGGVQLSYASLVNPCNAPEKVFTRVWTNVVGDLWIHELSRTRRFLEDNGIQVGEMKPAVWTTVEDERFARERINSGSVLGLFLGASRSERCWPVEKWCDLVKRQQLFREIVLFGAGPKDAAIAREITTTVGASVKVINLVGCTTLRQLFSSMGCCCALVSNDSSGLHMGVIAGIPVVGILGGYHYGRFYPWGDPSIHRVASLVMPCFHCSNHCIYGDFRCVKDISVEHVLNELSVAVNAARGRLDPCACKLP